MRQNAILRRASLSDKSVVLAGTTTALIKIQISKLPDASGLYGSA